MPGSGDTYRLLPLAEADLEEIWVYTFETWSLDQADSYHNDIVSTIEELAAGWRKGRRVDIRDGYFKCAVGSHFIFYRHSDLELIVVRILHQKMDANRHL